ncbi:MAG TPA: CDP-alcohol phosphatidyltransferase family protein [Rugosimonospora sp.]|nr:CDP-alcohol phosphatidyltransferase family protein [Rugosimonospora sp.]
MTALAANQNPTSHTAAEFLGRNRGGGLFTETVNQRLAAHLNVLAYRLGAPPTALSLVNLFLGLATSITVGLLANQMRDGGVPAVAVGLAALVGWQVAYTLDCADGQLARVTGKASLAGRRVDVLCDVALQICLVAAVGTVVRAYHPDTPAWLLAAFAGTWMVNLVTSELQKGDAAQSLITSGSLPVRLVKLVRDYGAVITVIALVLAFQPAWVLAVLVAFTAINGLFLLASIAAAVKASLRPAGD